MVWFFASDLHGHLGRYRALLSAMEAERPAVVLLGGDLLPHPMARLDGLPEGADFAADFLAPAFADLRARLGAAAPRVLLILGNDDPRAEEPFFLSAAAGGLWDVLHERTVEVDGYTVTGYPFVPPTPFLLKDWERYDVSRYVDPGCVPPEEGQRTVPVSEDEATLRTIATDLATLAAGLEPARSIWLCHAPPHRTALDRAALDGRSVESAPLDPHVGSVALRRFFERTQPLLGLHGHVHESARMTGAWRDRLVCTELFTAAHDGPELALVRFDPARLAQASRALIPPVA